jgi:GNAT superfamily N-acetyltransferase
MTERTAGSAVIHRWLDVPGRERLLEGIDRVFFASSATTSFASEDIRAAFRERWLGRYLARYPEWAYVALASPDDVIGYIVGSLEDPARSALFCDIAYFRDFAAVTPFYPAQLHVNLAPEWRGHGIGSRLIQRFVADVSKTGAPGVHVVTARGMRNIGYYASNGFTEVASTTWNGKDLVMLGRRLEAV